MVIAQSIFKIDDYKTMEELLNDLQSLSPITLFALFFLQNFIIAVVAVILGFWIDGSLMLIAQKISRKEIYWAMSTVFFNSVITMLGYYLFKIQIVVFDFSKNPFVSIVDFILLVLLMDLLMYLFHSIIHRISFLYKYHDLHHHYNEPTAISLFVLHPIEVVGFGVLWLILISLFTFSFYATIVYLIFNVLMGIAGHLEKELVPDFIKYNFYLKWFATTSFHRDHHRHEKHNLGFYTSIWDRILGTWIDSKDKRN